MKCPNCDGELDAYHWDNRTSIKIISYSCGDCFKDFERHTILDNKGMVKKDQIYEINDAGTIIMEWK